MDDLDRLILSALQQDGRTPFTHMAKQAGVSETTIRSRYRHLVEEGIVRTVGIVDPAALDFRAPAIITVIVEPGAIDRVARAVAEIPEVSYLVATLGSRDLIVEVLCRDLAHLTQVATERIQMIPGVRTAETLVIARSYKLSYRWSPVPAGPAKRCGR
jgi:Lrp/AsnC family transcriptional regulator for asnA, asnC and gidA